ncbi:hypothetical protein WJX72_007972 [[Myrmecia] bisecta]|uniref:Phosphodiesterase n=1 Tax=[Myrmecia] bisecta TaxID=41462 RepID=A0AAW1PA83_9CHLO
MPVPAVPHSFFFCDLPLLKKDNELEALLAHTWTLEQLQLYNQSNTPCWLVRSFHDPSSPVYVGVQHISANAAATRRFGRLRTVAEAREVIASWSQEEQRRRKEELSYMMDYVVAKGHTLRGCCKVATSLNAVFKRVQPTEGPVCLVCKPIRMLLGGQEVMCVYAEIVETISVDRARMVAMQQLTPIHHFLFGQRGQLLLANHAAMAKYGGSAPITFMGLLKEGEFEGGSLEIMQVHQQAMDAIFVHKVVGHQFLVSHFSRHNPGQLLHKMVKMWPMADPASGKPAMLVATFDRTEQIQLQAELEEHQRRLETQNQQLAVHNQKLMSQQAELMSQNERLTEQLESATQSTGLAAHVDTTSAADKTMLLLQGLLQGKTPKPNEVRELMTTISQEGDLRQPLQLEKQLLEHNQLDHEVGQSMVHMLTAGRRRTSSGSIDRSQLVQCRIEHEKKLASLAEATPPDTPPSGREGSAFDRSLSELQREDRSGSMQRSSSSGSSGSGHGALERPMLADPPICASLTTQTERLLQDAESGWMFDVFALHESSPTECLSILAFWLLKQSGVIKRCALNEHRLAGFLRRVEAGYKPNPYHNRHHAASVIQTMHMLLHHGGLRQHGVADDFESLACYLAAAVHDFEHPGFTNEYLVKVEDDIAITYNDQAPLESHHLAAAFRLMQNPQFNFLADLCPVDRACVRSNIIDQVQSTNMLLHFHVVSRFQSMYQRVCPATLASLARQPSNLEDRGAVSWEQLTVDDRAMIRQAALKVADISHLAHAMPVHLEWVGRLEQELFLQGDCERQRGLPISPLMDRNGEGITRSQVGFYDIVALPLFRSFVDVFPASAPLLEAANANRTYWKEHQ